MKRKLLLFASWIVFLSTLAFAQPGDEAYRQTRWKAFNKNSFHTFDFARKRLARAQLAKLKIEDEVDDFALLRGVVFGKHGRVFKERSIQEYLEKQPWYKPNKNYKNASLTAIERANLDLIRLAEAEKHMYVEPGDMRIWQRKLITEDNLRSYSPAELTILIAEVEAIHGKTFQEEWLQKYFDERYWYKRNAAYSPATLTEIERKNIERLLDEKKQGRNTSISVGDMGNFQMVALTESHLSGLTLLELRILREEFYARRGKRFDAPGIRQYFDWRDWYKPAKAQSTVKLGKVEQQNVDLLAAYETKIRERLSTELLNDDTLGDMFAEDLRVLRNEIYARRGRVFKDPQLQKYFESQPWYKPNPDFKDDQLSAIESQNLAKIADAEKSAVSKFSEFEG